MTLSCKLTANRFSFGVNLGDIFVYFHAYVQHMGSFSFFQLKKTIEDGVQKMIVNYRDDPDLQNLIDWVQADWVSQQYQTLQHSRENWNIITFGVG